jgi:hypothetical protein
MKYPVSAREALNGLSRKPSCWEECTPISRKNLSKEVRAWVSTLPVIDCSTKHPLDGQEAIKSQYFVATVDNLKYLVDTQGYDYCRYAGLIGKRI